MTSKHSQRKSFILCPMRVSSDDDDEPIGRRRRRETRRNGRLKRLFSIEIENFFSLLARTLVDTSNSGSPTTGRLPHGVRSVKMKTEDDKKILRVAFEFF